MIFKLNIRLGNAAMLTSADVADALDKVRRKVLDRDPIEAAENGYECSGVVQDANGNTVGTWEVER